MKAEVDGLRLAKGFAGQGADVFKSDRIALLGHDAADLDPCITQAQVAEFRGTPQEKILRDAAKI